MTALTARKRNMGGSSTLQLSGSVYKQDIIAPPPSSLGIQGLSKDSSSLQLASNVTFSSPLDLAFLGTHIWEYPDLLGEETALNSFQEKVPTLQAALRFPPARQACT